MSQQRKRITPKYVNLSKKPGGNWGTVKEGSDTYMAEKFILEQMQAGRDYTCMVELQNWKDGAVNVIVGIADEPQNISASPDQRNDPSQHVDKDMLIFVTGCVGRALGSGQFGITDIKVLTQSARAAFETVMQGKPEADPDERVPF